MDSSTTYPSAAPSPHANSSKTLAACELRLSRALARLRDATVHLEFARAEFHEAEAEYERALADAIRENVPAQLREAA